MTNKFYFPESKTNYPEKYEQVFHKFKQARKNDEFDFQKFINKQIHVCEQENTEEVVSSKNSTTIMISGKIDEKSLKNIFSSVLRDYRNSDLDSGSLDKQKRNIDHLVIRLELIRDNELNLAYLDAFLFNLVVLRMIKLEGHIRFLPYDTRVKFELAHSQDLNLLKELQVFGIISTCKLSFDLGLFYFDSSPGSCQQIVGSLLGRLKDGSVGFSSPSDVDIIPESISFERLIRLFREFFVEKSRSLEFGREWITFAHLNQFLRILCREFLACEDLLKETKMNPEKLKNVYLSLVSSTIHLIKPFIKSIEMQKQAFQFEFR